MSSMNFESAHEPVTLYGRTINFKARVINGHTYFVPRHITYDVSGQWVITLNNKRTFVTAGEDLHYSLNVAWKELKRRMSEEQPAKRKRPRVHAKSRGKRLDTCRVGALVRVQRGRCYICALQTLDGKQRRSVIASRPVQEVTHSWLSGKIALAVKVRERYETLAQTGQLRELVKPEDIGDCKIEGPWPRVVTVQEVLDEHKRQTGEELIPINTSSGDTKTAPERIKEGRIHIELDRPKEWGKNEVRTPALTIGRWLLPRLAAVFKRLAQWFETQGKALK